MTRDELLNSICPMSRVYDCCIADGDYDCDKCKRLTKEWFDEYDKQIRADAIDEFAKAIICELKNKHTDMPIVDILGSREKWKEKNSQYLECENLAYKIAKKLKAGGINE